MIGRIAWLVLARAPAALAVAAIVACSVLLRLLALTLEGVRDLAAWVLAGAEMLGLWGLGLAIDIDAASPGSPCSVRTC